MVRAAIAGELAPLEETQTGDRIRVEIATPAHDAPLRRLLRENPMPGAISLSMEREPSYFAAAALEGPEHKSIVVFENDRLIGAGSISARQRFINGRPTRVGYLGALRLDAPHRGRASLILRGYEAFRKIHRQGGPAIYMTSIVADNLPARRFLERGLPAMPTYKFLAELVTLVLPCRAYLHAVGKIFGSDRNLVQEGIIMRRGSPESDGELLDLLNREQQNYQLAPVWQASELHPETFLLACRKDGKPLACAAIWDQRAIKQTVVRGYANNLRRMRPLLNFAAACLGKPRLPRIGTPISHAFLAHLAVRPDHAPLAKCLVNELRQQAHTLGIDYLTLGFDARDPRLQQLRKAFHPREYLSRIYIVHWEDGAALAKQIDDRLLAPEIATL